MHLFFKITSYLNFLYHSKNHHSLHSPFVYDLTTKCLYKKLPLKNNYCKELFQIPTRNAYLIGKIIQYLQLESKENLHFFSRERNVYEIRENVLKIIAKNCEKSVILIDELYQNKERYLLWQSFLKEKNIIVSVNLYKIGLLFFSKRQSKQDFMIRL